jgi:hypothetical protein
VRRAAKRKTLYVIIQEFPAEGAAHSELSVARIKMSRRRTRSCQRDYPPEAGGPIIASRGLLHCSVIAEANFGDNHMGLKLVASNDDRALAIRDHLLPLVRHGGGIEVQRGLVRLVTLEQAPWVISHWTPFNDLQPGEASSPGYRHAVERQHSIPDLPYGLEVWHGTRVFRVLWADDGRFEVESFVRGQWEDLALALSRGAEDD